MIAAKPFPPGIHVPCLTWFADDARQEIDWDLQKQHLRFLISSGLHGVVLAGTNGEAVTLSPAEKQSLVRATREIALDLGRKSEDFTITLGCGGQSTQHVIEETKQAADAGADYALVLVPSYFHFAMNEKAIIDFFEELADASSIPIMIYNFPGVAAGLDVNSDTLDKLGTHPNIVGVKLTCGGIGKVSRVRARFTPSEFCTLAGQSDWLLPAMSVGSIGSITGVANAFPRVTLELYNTSLEGSYKAAEAIQHKVAKMEWGLLKGGINGTKWVVAKVRGYPEPSCHCRRPYPKYDDADKQRWILDTVSELEAEEEGLISL